jgi:hypothetical protein
MPRAGLSYQVHVAVHEVYTPTLDGLIQIN